MRVRAILAAVLAWAGFAGAAPAAVDLPAPGELVQARLVAESASLAPGKTLWVALHLTVKPGWHVYWRNPGDSGLPTEIAWHLPPGFSAGAIDWPAPQRFVVGGLANYGYTGTADLLVPIAVPATLPGGPLTLRAEASWLVCAEICIPGGAKLALDLAPGTGAPDPDAAALFAAARRRLPQPAPFAAQFSAADRDYRLFLPGVDGGSRIEFFPYDGNLIDHAAERRRRHPGAGEIRRRDQGAGPARRRRRDRRRRLCAERRAGRRPRGRFPARLVAGAGAGLCRRRRAQPDAVRVPDPVAEAAEPGRAGAAPRRTSRRPRLRRRRRRQLCRAGIHPAGAARRRRGGRLGVPAAIAARRRAARLPDAGDGAEPVRRRRVRLRPGRRRQPVHRAWRDGRRLCRRRPGGGGGDTVHRAVHGRRAGLCRRRAGAAGARRVRRPRRRDGGAADRGELCPGGRAAPAAVRSLDGDGEAGPRLPALRDGRLAGLGAAPGGRAGERAGGAVRPRPGRLRGVALRRQPRRRAARPPPRRRARRGGAHRRDPAGGECRPRRRRLAGGAGRASLSAVQQRPAGGARSREAAGVRQPDRVMVPDLPGQRTHRARPRGGARGVRPPRPRRAEGRLDPPEPGDHRIAAELRPQRRAALPALRRQGRHRRPAAAVDRGDGARRGGEALAPERLGDRAAGGGAAAVDDVVRAGGVAGEVRAQEQHGAGDFLGD